MSDKRLSELLQDSGNALDDAIEELQKATTEAIQAHFDVGMQIERERIIKLLEGKRCRCLDLDKDEFVALAKKEGLLQHSNCEYVGLDWVLELIKGEQK